ncbi:hypothetical protein HII36_41665 [Nonomuraea sp. NN258]|uniref:hypothetical protein n=1 Tax=Nonomuraea antri TaxID=2730852 RepID=UPI00156811EB|nr:hypothetical protein [Nonomuraea antri]NRQ38291.1 hypothetical protein [Nonomuraea antri]
MNDPPEGFEKHALNGTEYVSAGISVGVSAGHQAHDDVQPPIVQNSIQLSVADVRPGGGEPLTE